MCVCLCVCVDPLKRDLEFLRRRILELFACCLMKDAQTAEGRIQNVRLHYLYCREWKMVCNFIMNCSGATTALCMIISIYPDAINTICHLYLNVH